MSNKPKSTRETISIGMEAAKRAKVSALLAGILADQHVLYIKTRNFHWNLVGKRFHSLHEFYEEQYGTLAMAIDETAERVRMLGGTPPGSMKEFLDLANLTEEMGALVDGDHTINELVKDHESCVRKLRDDIAACEDDLDDVGTADFLTGLLRSHEQAAWMLRSFLL